MFFIGLYIAIIDVSVKYDIYLAIHINILLLDCESVALSETLLKKLEVFHKRCLILNGMKLEKKILVLGKILLISILLK